jgi:uncharacterized membrane protein YesL
MISTITAIDKNFFQMTSIENCDMMGKILSRRACAMFKNLFNPDNALMTTMSQVTDCIFLSLFWILTSFPLVTIGASSAALYDAVYYGFRQGDKHPWGRFLKSFRSNLKSGFLPGVIYLVIFCFGAWGLIQVWNAAVWEKVSFAAFSAAAFVVMLLLGILSILFPMLSRFNNSLWGLLRNTLLIGIVNLPRTLGLGLINGLSILLCVKFIFPLFFLPALASLLGTLCIEPMFKPYMGEKETPAESMDAAE